MEQEQVDTSAAFDATGSLRVGFTLSKEEIEALRTLASSPFWKLYAKILMAAREEHLTASTMVTSVDHAVKMIHLSGMAAGIKFCVNQLQILCADHDARAKKELEKSKPSVQPFRRG